MSYARALPAVTPSSEEFAECAIDGSGRAHVMDMQGNASGYTIEDGDSWQVESPPKLGPFALDESGAAHIAAGLDGMTYVTNAGGAWQSEHVSGEIMAEFPTAVAVAPAGTVHVLTVRREAMYVQSDVSYSRRDGIWAGPVPVALPPHLGDPFLFADDDGIQIVDTIWSPIGESQWREQVQIRVTRSLPYDEDCGGLAE